MNRKILTLLVCVAIVFNNYAQTNTNFYKVFFKVDESNLDDEDYTTLNQIISDLKQQTYYEINLTAHTDFNASYIYNEALSKRRAVSVMEYLTSKGLQKEFIKVNCLGEYKPVASNLSDEGKAMNRRVEISVKKITLNQTKDLIEVIKPVYEQEFKLNQKGQTTILSENGMKISVPDNAFVTKDGKTVNQEQVVVKLEEFHSPFDFMMNQLSTISDGKMLESGGMFKITATFNEQELEIKKDKPLNVEMPSKNIQSKMNVFTGIKNSNGVMEWEIKKETFNLKNNDVKLAECAVVLNQENLQKLYAKETFNITNLNFKHQYPYKVQMPKMPKQPKKLEYPTENEIFTWVERITLSKKEIQNRMKIEMDKIDALNLKKTQKYEKKLNHYYTKLKSYPQDSANYVIAVQNYEKWMNNEVENLSNNIKLNYQNAFNRGVSKLISYNNNKKLNCKNYPNFLNNNTKLNEKEQQEVYKYRLYLSTLIEIKNNNNLIKTYFKNGIINYSNLSLIKYIKRKYHNIIGIYDNDIWLSSQINPYIKETMIKANMDRIKNNGINNNTLVNDSRTIYQASLSNMGYINCDRFSNQPMVNIEIESEVGMQINIYVKSVNGMLTAYYNPKSKKYIATVPKNVNVNVLVIGVKNGKPVFDSKSTMFDKSNQLVTKPEITSAERIMEYLKKV